MHNLKNIKNKIAKQKYTYKCNGNKSILTLSMLYVVNNLKTYYFELF